MQQNEFAPFSLAGPDQLGHQQEAALVQASALSSLRDISTLRLSVETELSFQELPLLIWFCFAGSQGCRAV